MRKTFRRVLWPVALTLAAVGTANATPPMPMPPFPRDAGWLISQPEPPLLPTGDPKVDAYRASLIEGADAVWRPIFRRLLANVRADPSLIQRFDRMREVDTPAEYVRHYLTDRRIAQGRALYRSMKRTYRSTDGTPLELKLALWGALSDYGKRPDTDLLSAMLTLGAYGKLHQTTAFPIHDAALLVLDRTVDRKGLRGYDSGRMGQAQMTPDFYTRLRRDGDGDGRVDIWKNRADIFANLWVDMTGTDGPLIIPVKPHRLDPNDRAQARLLAGMRQSTLPTYFKRWDGKPWTAATSRNGGRYVEPFGKSGPAFLLPMVSTPVAFRDPYALGYQVNEDAGFSIAVLLLAEAIAGRPIPDRRLMTR